MCRLLIYKGKRKMLLADLITRPQHSIINQSFDSRLRIDTRRPINGDGFGVGYYTQDPSSPDPEIGSGPCIFTAITPAWNNLNLARLAEKTKSALVFAHVRASTAGILAEVNCHPWSFGSLMWMHNGNIAAFPKIKRRLQTALRDQYFLHVAGNTDSEWAFALFLNCLHDSGHDPSSSPASGFGPEVLRKAMLATVDLLKGWTKEAQEGEDEDGREPSMMNFAVTDGESVVCTRYITSRTQEAASLYFSSGSSFHEYKPGGHYRMERRDRGQDIVLVASEPLTFERADWVTVPNNSCLTIRNQMVLLHPIIDEYYTEPAMPRSSEHAESHGLHGADVKAHIDAELGFDGAESPLRMSFVAGVPEIDTQDLP